MSNSFKNPTKCLASRTSCANEFHRIIMACVFKKASLGSSAAYLVWLWASHCLSFFSLGLNLLIFQPWFGCCSDLALHPSHKRKKSTHSRISKSKTNRRVFHPQSQNGQSPSFLTISLSSLFKLQMLLSPLSGLCSHPSSSSVLLLSLSLFATEQQLPGLPPWSLPALPMLLSYLHPRDVIEPHDLPVM